MMGNISKLVLLFCLVFTVTDSALLRMKRQQSDGEENPVGRCKDMRVPYGGIRLYPVGSDNFQPSDDRCKTNPDLDCEFRFYCDEGFESIGHQEIRCVTHDTGESEFVGTFPICTPIGENHGSCGVLTVPNGRIEVSKIYIDDTHSLWAYPCEGDLIYCEPRLYCDEGYEETGSRNIYCGTNGEIGVNVYKYIGDSPVCEEKVQPDSPSHTDRDRGKYGDGPFRLRNHMYLVGIIPVSIVIVIIAVVARALRLRYRRQRCIIRTNTMDLTPESTGASTGELPYARFDDSHIQVPRDQGAPDIQVKLGAGMMTLPPPRSVSVDPTPSSVNVN